jgi:hypothetical protein
MLRVGAAFSFAERKASHGNDTFVSTQVKTANYFILSPNIWVLMSGAD